MVFPMPGAASQARARTWYRNRLWSLRERRPVRPGLNDNHSAICYRETGSKGREAGL